MDDNNPNFNYGPEWPEPPDSFLYDYDPLFFDFYDEGNCMFSQLWIPEYENTGPQTLSNRNVHPQIFRRPMLKNKKDSPICGSYIEFKYGFYKIFGDKKNLKSNML